MCVCLIHSFLFALFSFQGSFLTAALNERLLYVNINACLMSTISFYHFGRYSFEKLLVISLFKLLCLTTLDYLIMFLFIESTANIWFCFITFSKVFFNPLFGDA
jgi:hypothetical protein